MKNTPFRILALSALLITTLACSQKTENIKTNEVKTANTVSVEVDSAAVLEAKKKVATEEKAKLPKPYNDKENAEAKIAELVKQAQAENKNIILQAGGNWCIWCLRFNQFVQTTPELKNIIDENYLYYHLNYSPENKNEKVFAKYDNPGAKFGYPVFIVLDKNGKMIHTQDSAVLEEGKGYSTEKVKAFFQEWAPKS
ncbi:MULTISPECIES: thioredoxin family protein [unclassified Kaistella]|uniref:thioredoxin family protein n=1 Tax=unclassified Kaistella TaxID=2762626 RepID=UPI0027338396|nr:MULTISPECIES: thioredoxin family protein [unclassified Kaistella]MDP2454840.1 thioredoxin family protein [Kaistella sp. SH11-4b]MDP2457577.1 thioredoxin family protein [Kaistella sp. SH40-3]MDP2460337.1 thioredoxin family protein [Kaistella sp. SH19-2b]